MFQLYLSDQHLLRCNEHYMLDGTGWYTVYDTGAWCPLILWERIIIVLYLRHTLWDKEKKMHHSGSSDIIRNIDLKRTYWYLCKYGNWPLQQLRCFFGLEKYHATGPHLNKKTVFPSIGITIIKMYPYSGNPYTGKKAILYQEAPGLSLIFFPYYISVKRIIVLGARLHNCDWRMVGVKPTIALFIMRPELRNDAWWCAYFRFSALLTLCVGNSLVTGEFPHKGQFGLFTFGILPVSAMGSRYHHQFF